MPKQKELDVQAMHINQTHKQAIKTLRKFQSIKRLRVIMTYNDIRSGIQCKARICPVALAAARALKQRLRYTKAVYAGVFADVYYGADVSVVLTVALTSQRFRVPARISKFIAGFDAGEKQDWNFHIGRDDWEVYESFYLQRVIVDRPTSQLQLNLTD